ncbi:MAG: hypothetical protein NTV54_14515, partial [Ignavibacteriales bacterium]|nr:hypothetical protein [Ignavibacteriales bacterium]
MKKATVLLLCTFLFIAVSSERSTAGNVKSAGVKGNWSAPATWATGVLPSAADTAIVADGDTVLYDMTWAVGDTIAKLVIGEGAPAVLRFPKTDSTKLLIKGGLWIRSGASLRAQTATVAPGLQHLITIGGDFLCDGIMDARIGSAGSTMGVINFEFTGSTNSNITFSNKDSVTIATANYEFNGMKINKSGNANVYLGSNIIFASGSSTDAYRNVNVVFAKGKVFTGNYALITTSTTGATLPAGSDTTGYIVGAMGRGTSSGGGTREYYVGDAKAYRPITVNTTIGNGANGNYVIVRLISGNGNSLCGTYGSGIDKVSTGRYYQVTWNKGTTTTTSMKFGFFSPSYRDDDGVVAGSVNLRAAILDTSKTSWTNLGPTTAVYTTMMDSLPRRLNTDTLASA